MDILHFVSSTKNAGEYVVLTQDSELDPQDHCGPGYKLAHKVVVEKKSGDEFGLLPLDAPLHPSE